MELDSFPVFFYSLEKFTLHTSDLYLTAQIDFSCDTIWAWCILFFETCISFNYVFSTFLDYLWIQFSASLGRKFGYFFRKSTILCRILIYIARGVHNMPLEFFPSLWHAITLLFLFVISFIFCFISFSLI